MSTPHKLSHAEAENVGLAAHDLVNEFWKDFSKLVGQTLSMAPPELENDLLERLGEKTSVYGSDYETYLLPKWARPTLRNWGNQ